jgi:hypothetical protein
MYRIIGADGREYGPVNVEQLRRWIAEGRANAQTRTVAEGTMDWKPLSLFPEFSFLLQPTPSPIVPPTYAPIRRTNAFAITGFILGLFSATGGICCFGHLFMILGLIFSLIGLSQIKNNPDLYDGKGLAIAGVVLSIIGFILSIGLILFFFLASLLSETSHHGAYRL